ncbi:hypothetical protein ABEB36_011138 [Hypothenemus hampei]|uniref:Uncharacterized protein n=1 Tax=Hypothenemus hampei TaxID=57062 RepID=A0ABD1EED3_HYPHA
MVISYAFTSSILGATAQAQTFVFDNTTNIGIHKLAPTQAQAVPVTGSTGGTTFKQSAGTDGGYGGGFSVGNKGGFVGGYGGGFTGPDGNGFSFSGPIGGAFASGSIGPGGAHQIASVFPENPNSPNINTQFGGSLLGDGGDFKSVFTSSKTVSTNVDGKPQTFRQASTTVNDNGKITTYTAHNP